MSRDFLSGNWKYWSNLRAPTTASLYVYFFRFHRGGGGGFRVVNSYFRVFSTERKFQKHCSKLLIFVRVL